MLNVGKPLQQAQQAAPEGAAFMTTVWGHHSDAQTQTHTQFNIETRATAAATSVR